MKDDCGWLTERGITYKALADDAKIWPDNAISFQVNRLHIPTGQQTYFKIAIMRGNHNEATRDLCVLLNKWNNCGGWKYWL